MYADVGHGFPHGIEVTPERKHTDRFDSILEIGFDSVRQLRSDSIFDSVIEIGFDFRFGD
jgi:hypothetical protein